MFFMGDGYAIFSLLRETPSGTCVLMILLAQQEDDQQGEPTRVFSRQQYLQRQVTEASSQSATAQPDQMSTLNIQASKELKFFLYKARDDELSKSVCAEAISPNVMLDASPADFPRPMTTHINLEGRSGPTNVLLMGLLVSHRQLFSKR